MFWIVQQINSHNMSVGNNTFSKKFFYNFMVNPDKYLPKKRALGGSACILRKFVNNIKYFKKSTTYFCKVSCKYS